MRKRGKRFTWMPTLGTESNINPGAETLRISGRAFGLDVFGSAGPTFPGSQGSINTLIFPIIPDAPLEGGATVLRSDTAGALADAVGTEWFCERITGHLFLAFRLPDVGQQVATSVLVTAGFFVARANDAESGGGLAQPIGSASLTERDSNYSPQSLDAIREPWMWRKSWMLGGAANTINGFSLFPSNNAFYGSIADGPKVECKSVRRIGQDDRLWFAVSCVSLGPEAFEVEQTFTQGIQGYLDVRVLGNTRKAKSSGKF